MRHALRSNRHTVDLAVATTSDAAAWSHPVVCPAGDCAYPVPVQCHRWMKLGTRLVAEGLGAMRRAPR